MVDGGWLRTAGFLGRSHPPSTISYPPTLAQPMRGFTVEYFKSLTEAIARVEDGTSAEIVVVIEPRSGSYRDVDLALGAAAALLTLIALVYSPWQHSELMSILDVAVFFALGVWISSAVPAVRRALTRPARRSLQVRDAAAATFCL